jgi:pre-mRNA-splicing helicase BRR2
VRMVGSPALYNVGADYLEGDPTLIQKRGRLDRGSGKVR